MNEDLSGWLWSLLLLQVLLYALMSPKDCYTDFHIDFCGSAVWYHLVSGRKVFVLAPPTAHNLAAYQAWVGSKRQVRQALAPGLQGVQAVPIETGDTLIIPPGEGGRGRGEDGGWGWEGVATNGVGRRGVDRGVLRKERGVA
jgi:hypothetical protein